MWYVTREQAHSVNMQLFWKNNQVLVHYWVQSSTVWYCTESFWALFNNMNHHHHEDINDALPSSYINYCVYTISLLSRPHWKHKQSISFRGHGKGESLALSFLLLTICESPQQMGRSILSGHKSNISRSVQAVWALELMWKRKSSLCILLTSSKVSGLYVLRACWCQWHVNHFRN